MIPVTAAHGRGGVVADGEQTEKAADWEFTYDSQGGRTHVLNRNVLANSEHAYALYWSTPATEWSESFRFFQVFARTFHPAPA